MQSAPKNIQSTPNSPSWGVFLLQFNRKIIIICILYEQIVLMFSKEAQKLDEKKYTNDGFLIVSENYTCPLWEKDTKPCRSGWTRACFFCKFADFRTPEFIRRAEEQPRGEKLYSVCHNEKNNKAEEGE